jgi:hypothetical protein
MEQHIVDPITAQGSVVRSVGIAPGGTKKA